MIGLPQASSFAAPVDELFDAMLLLSALVVVAVFTTILWFSVKYRHGSTVDRTLPPRRTLPIELAWTLVPFLLFVAVFAWSISLFAHMSRPPAGTDPIYVVAKQWMWTVQHPGGQREINTLHVSLGQPTRLIMTSQDVIHSFYVPAFRVKQDVLPGRYTQLWFTATQAGTYHLFCAEYCGTDHARMGGSVIVMQAGDYARWLDSHPGAGLAAEGAALFHRLGCSGCHDPQSGVHAPTLYDLYGSTVPLSDGTQVRADDRYLHDSIMLPGKQVAAGYAPVMPSYEGRIGEDDVLALIEYLKSRHSPEVQ
ncbi:MAG TPA: cytochrome c oxidase subunit II [Steroidobacteraceae bacterium]|nr:cytochrome c oxidase subunit II [Steroidobacteraceae bacterium]